MDLNKVMLIGRLTRDPEAKTTPQGTAVTNFSIATSRVWKDTQGAQQEATEFHNIVAWRRLAEICAQYLKKGRQIYLEGHLQTRNWQGQDGKKNYRTEIVADNMIMLGNKSDNTSAPAPSPAARIDRQVSSPVPAMTEAPATINEEEIRIEDIPF